ncbi:MAG: hypothetical protein KTR14_01245 [Vampirovibrio sp.]|nr:hypothetical protein [Vampirovibrio sp.]
MILEAFSHELQAKYGKGEPSEKILHQWLLTIMQMSRPKTQVERVLHQEVMMVHMKGQVIFQGRSESGHGLLRSLYNYCKSYDHWQFSRWLHEIKASDFSVSI